MRQIDVDLLRQAGACARCVTIAPSKIKQFNAGPGCLLTERFRMKKLLRATMFVGKDLNAKVHI